MHIHILGVCGTFMGSLAQLAKSLGYRVTGSDANVYPPMSTQLEAAGIELIEGYDVSQLDPEPDLIVIGNAMSRGNPVVEAVLERGLNYTSGPQWLRDHVLPGRWVLAVSGTHGKTTTASMLTWILAYAGMKPGYLIGGVPKNFTASASLGDSVFFVVEADEYDSAFFDKRSKFIHYRPNTLVMNNLEFDHADIFDDLAAIQTQFHHLVRTVPANGLIIYPDNETNLDAVLQRGCWTPIERTGIESGVPANKTVQWCARLSSADGSRYEVIHEGQEKGEVVWSSTGHHNVRNGIAAIAAARNVGVAPETAIAALSCFEGVKRRMECLGRLGNISVYDDFAHHPTAIATTLEGLRARIGSARIVVLIEPRSNTMRMGVHRDTLAKATACADLVLWYQPADTDWGLASVVSESPVPARLMTDTDAMIDLCADLPDEETHIVIMSNGGFGGLHTRLMNRLDKMITGEA